MRKRSLVAALIAVMGGASGANAGVVYRTTVSATPGVVFELTFLDSVASSTAGWTLPDAPLSAVLEGGISGFRADFGDGNGFLTALSGDMTRSHVGAMRSNDGSSIDFGQFYPGIPSVAFSNGYSVGTPTLAFDHSWYSDGTNPRIAGAYAYEYFGSTAIPEPSTYALVAAALGWLGLQSRRRRSGRST